MPLPTVGRNHLAGLAIGEALTPFNNANAHLSVGNGVTAFAVGDTDLVGASKTRKAMDATFPTRATNVLTFKSTFITTEANHAWDEVGVHNAAAAGVMLSRVVTPLGTKTSASSWALTHVVTMS